MATHSSVLAWRIPGTGEPCWAAVYGFAQSRTRPKRLSSSSSNIPSYAALPFIHVPLLVLLKDTLVASNSGQLQVKLL